MRRYAHAKREHVITSVNSAYRILEGQYTHIFTLTQLDALLFELFALSYLLDPVILRFLFRATAQAQFSRPRDLDRSLRFMFIYCSLVNVGPVFRHLLPSFHYETQGLLLDFVGRCEPPQCFASSSYIQKCFEQATPPARAHLVCLDIGIFVLQILCLFIAYEAHDNSEQDELAYVPEQPPNDSCSNRTLKIRSPSGSGLTYLSVVIAEDGSPEKLDDNAPILHLRLRNSFRKIYQSASEHPPPSNASNLPLPNTTRRTNTISSSASPMSRLVTMVQRRLEQQRTSREPGAGNGETRTSSMPGGMVGA